MNANLLNIVKRIVADQGEGVLADPKRLKPLFTEYAKNEIKEERVAFGRCIEMGAYQELKKSRTPDERRRVKAALANKVHIKTGIDLSRCNDALDLLEAVLFTQASSTTPAAPHKKKHTLRNLIIAGAVLLSLILVIYSVHASIMHKARTFYDTGMTYYNNKDYDNAITQFSEAVKLDRNYALAYAYRGDANRKIGLYELAVIDLGEAVRLDPNNAWAYARRGAASLMISQYEAAIKDLNEAIRLEPNNAFAYSSRGDAYRLNNQYDLAIKDLNEAIKFDPNDVSIYAVRGDVYRLNNQYDMAIKDLDEAVRLNPTNAFAYSSRGDVYRLINQYDMAIKDLTEAIRLNPDDAFSYVSRGIAYSMKNQYEAAIKDLNEAIRLYNIKFFYSQNVDNIGVLQIKEEEINTLLKERKDKLTDTNHAWAYANRGQIYWQLGQTNQAIQDFENAISLNPDYGWAKQRLREIRGY
jgi:tetratricopeptide (TPR) repeat protein